MMNHMWDIRVCLSKLGRGKTPPREGADAPHSAMQSKKIEHEREYLGQGLLGERSTARRRGQHRAASSAAHVTVDGSPRLPATRSESFIAALRVAQQAESTPVFINELERAVLDVLQADSAGIVAPALSFPPAPVRPKLSLGTRNTAIVHLYRYDVACFYVSYLHYLSRIAHRNPTPNPSTPLHYMRRCSAEILKMTSYRIRMDTTTNWAVTTTSLLTVFTLRSDSIPHWFFISIGNSCSAIVLHPLILTLSSARFGQRPNNSLHELDLPASRGPPLCCICGPPSADSHS